LLALPTEGLGSLAAYADAKRTGVIAIAGLAFILFVAFLTWSRASTWGYGLNSAILEVHHHPRSSLAHYELARQYRLKGNIDKMALTKARQHYLRADELSSTRSDGLFALLILEGQATDATQRQALLTRLEAKLSQAPLYASHANWLATLVSCYARQSCRIDEQDLLRLIRTMVKHKDIDKRGIIGAVIYANAADFILYSGKGSYQEMMALMKAAATTAPGNAEFRLGIVDKALAHGDIETAAHWIENLKTHSSSLYSQRIVELEQRLTRLTR